MYIIGDRLALYSGNDDQIVPLLALGGLGVISVLSNLLPAETREIYYRFAAGDMAGSLALQLGYHRLIQALFSDVNPIPVKAAMAALGFCDNYLRAPLLPMEKSAEEKLLGVMCDMGLSV